VAWPRSLEPQLVYLSRYGSITSIRLGALRSAHALKCAHSTGAMAKHATHDPLVLGSSPIGPASISRPFSAHRAPQKGGAVSVFY
jgi:hypothetical protein